MMNAEYKREDHKSYFVIRDERLDGEKDPEGIYGLEMLCSNAVAGLLPISLHSFNGEKELYYDISTKQSLRILYEKREFNRKDLKNLFLGIQTAVDSLEEYLLDMECLIMDPDYIYIRAADEGVCLLYYPFVEEDFEKTVYNFAEYILDHVCNEDEEAVVYAYGFYRYVKEEQGDLRQALKRVLENEESRKNEPQRPAPDVWEEIEKDDMGLYIGEKEDTLCPDGEKEESGEIRRCDFTAMITFLGVLGLGGIGMLFYSAWHYQLTVANLMTVKESVVGAGMIGIAAGGIVLFTMMRFRAGRERGGADRKITESQFYSKAGGDRVLEGQEVLERQVVLEKQEVLEEQEEAGTESELKEDISCETVLLQENCYQEQRILTGRIRGRKKQIDLSSFPFIIGKSKEQADYVLEDASVSRLHARFTLREDVVYLTDLNSTNGTSKNGMKLEPNELVMLEAGDEITFGRVSLTYH